MNTPDADLDFLKTRYATARNKYKPRDLKVLLVAEAPPCDLDRYFYFEDVKKQDSLFLEIMGVLYPEQKAAYMKAKRATDLKEELLREFQSDGYWLMDLSEIPHELMGEQAAYSLPSLLQRAKKYAVADTRIILIKANVFDACYEPLKAAGYDVSSERIPFPGSGQQGVFREKFANALNGL